MSRSRRYWPKALHDNIWISRPHAIVRYVQRGGLTDEKDMNHDKAEEELRYKLAEALQQGERLELPDGLDDGGKGDAFLLALQTSAGVDVYPLVRRGKQDGRFQFLVPTCFSAQQYEESQTGALKVKLGAYLTVPPDPVAGDDAPITEEERKAMDMDQASCDTEQNAAEARRCDPDPDGAWSPSRAMAYEQAKILLAYPGGIVPVGANCPVADAVLDLIMKGYPPSVISVFRRVPYNVSVNLHEEDSDDS